MVFRKIRFSGYNCTSKSPKLVDQSSPNFIRPTLEETLSVK